MLFLFACLSPAPTMAIWPFSEDADTGRELVLHGNIDIRQVDVAFEVGGRITGLAVEEGARVSEGDLLGSLDRRRYRQAVARAEARMRAQHDRLAALEAGTRREEIRRLRAELAAARAEADNAARRVRRLEALRERKLAAEEDVDDARSAREVAEARVKVVQRQLDLAVAGPREEDIQAARDELSALQAALARARIDLDDTRLRAPQAGVIRERLLQVGDMAGPDRPVFSLALNDPMWVRAYVAGPDLGRVAPGTPARILTDSAGEQGYQGWIGYVSPTAEFTPKSVETEEVRTDLVYQVRVMLCRPDRRLRLGMPATVRIAPGAEPEPVSERCDAGDVGP